MRQEKKAERNARVEGRNPWASRCWSLSGRQRLGQVLAGTPTRTHTHPAQGQLAAHFTQHQCWLRVAHDERAHFPTEASPLLALPGEGKLGDGAGAPLFRRIAWFLFEGDVTTWQQVWNPLPPIAAPKAPVLHENRYPARTSAAACPQRLQPGFPVASQACAYPPCGRLCWF